MDITKEQIKRNKNIDNILKIYSNNKIEIEIENMILKINNKFKITKKYNYIKKNNIELGKTIRYVDLNLNKISTTGIVVNISDNNILLFNQSNNIYWKINPDKYYLFEIENQSSKTKLFKKLLKKLNF